VARPNSAATAAGRTVTVTTASHPSSPQWTSSPPFAAAMDAASAQARGSPSIAAAAAARAAASAASWARWLAAIAAPAAATTTATSTVTSPTARTGTVADPRSAAPRRPRTIHRARLSAMV
jgi:hypothetical protein